MSFWYGASMSGSLCNTFKHIVGTMTPTDESRVKKHTKSTNYLINIMTMVLEPLTPPEAWI